MARLRKILKQACRKTQPFEHGARSFQLGFVVLPEEHPTK